MGFISYVFNNILQMIEALGYYGGMVIVVIWTITTYRSFDGGLKNREIPLWKKFLVICGFLNILITITHFTYMGIQAIIFYLGLAALLLMFFFRGDVWSKINVILTLIAMKQNKKKDKNDNE